MKTESSLTTSAQALTAQALTAQANDNNKYLPSWYHRVSFPNYLKSPPISKSYDLQRFAAEDEGRTELPSERRKREERGRGNVPRSQEIVSAAILMGVVMVFFISSVYMLKVTQTTFQSYLSFDFSRTQEIAQMASIRRIFLDMCLQTVKIIGPLLIAAMLLGIIANVSQFGLLFTAYPLGIRWSKIRPDFRRILPNRRTFFTLGRTLLQVSFISIAAYIIVTNDYIPMLKTSGMGMKQAILLFAQVAFKILIVAALILGLISVPDFLYQRHEYMENLKITVSEAKRERKEEEGDPMVRQRQLNRGYELRKQRSMLENTSDADVIITNPTHFAVGLKYDPATNQAPTLITKGADQLALIIRNIAKEHKIPIEENPPLARALYEDVELGQEIPDTLYRVVSLIFAKLQRFQKTGVDHA